MESSRQQRVTDPIDDQIPTIGRFSANTPNRQNVLDEKREELTDLIRQKLGDGKKIAPSVGSMLSVLLRIVECCSWNQHQLRDFRQTVLDIEDGSIAKLSKLPDALPQMEEHQELVLKIVITAHGLNHGSITNAMLMFMRKMVIQFPECASMCEKLVDRIIDGKIVTQRQLAESLPGHFRNLCLSDSQLSRANSERAVGASN